MVAVQGMPHGGGDAVSWILRHEQNLRDVEREFPLIKGLCSVRKMCFIYLSVTLLPFLKMGNLRFRKCEQIAKIIQQEVTETGFKIKLTSVQSWLVCLSGQK